jgi:uncharacterized protein YllA (UPF0747 family)
MEHLAYLEEDNLFKINVVQEDEQALEKMKKQIERSIKDKEAEIEEVRRNIDGLQAMKEVFVEKTQFLEGNMKLKNSNNSKDINNNSSKAQN